jgi:hypothetical protein
MLKAVEGMLRLLEVLEVMRCVVLCMLEAVESVGYAGDAVGIRCALLVLEVVLYMLEMLEGVCVPLCMLRVYAHCWSC